MSRLNVNPTRMELQRLKSRLHVAVKGHKLLKDKSDEMVRQFLRLSKTNTSYRETVEQNLSTALKSFLTASTQLHSQEIEASLMMPFVDFEITKSTTNIMGLIVPRLEINNLEIKELPKMNKHLHCAVKDIVSQLESLLRLAEIEKTCEMLAAEIEKNRRRINSLEFILIPRIEETTKYIVMKLSENERQNISRLMKIKNQST